MINDCYEDGLPLRKGKVVIEDGLPTRVFIRVEHNDGDDGSITVEDFEVYAPVRGGDDVGDGHRCFSGVI